MIKGLDVVLLLWLGGRQGVPPTFGTMANYLHADVAGLHRASRVSVRRLLGPDRNVQLAQADEFLSHSLRYLFPPYSAETFEASPPRGPSSAK